MYRVFAISILFTIACSAWGDDVIEAIEQATDLYESGQTQQAISQLEFAAQLIRQQRGSGLQAFLPEPLEGWSAEDANSSTSGIALFGGGTSVERSYSDGSKNVTIRILTDSPMMQAFMMMFSNPAIASAQGGALKMIAGQRALVNPDGITIVLQNTYLIQVEGNASSEDYVAYAGAIDFAGLRIFN